MPIARDKESLFKRYGSWLLVVFCVALLVRLVPALDYGRDWYATGSFTLINFDEAGSCRAALDGFEYSPLVGWQTIGIAAIAGIRPADGSKGDARAVKAFCHSQAHIQVARVFSAVMGALTVVLVALIAGQLFPAQPSIAQISALLMTFSGWHISESMVGTVDATSTFCIYLFFWSAIWAAQHGGLRWLFAAVALALAVGTKYWIFALMALVYFVPVRIFHAVLAGLSGARLAVLALALSAVFALVTNPATPEYVVFFSPLLFYLFVPWKTIGVATRVAMLLVPWSALIALQIESFVAFTSGGLSGRFGTDYGVIGHNKWLRNSLNVPVVLLVGLGLPAAIAAVAGLGALFKQKGLPRYWLVLLPLPVFALYMLFLAPVTYYRHYLPLLPAACILAAYALACLTTHKRKLVFGVMILWQMALAWDLVSDYYLDPRRELPQWYAKEKPQQVIASFYVAPPPNTEASHKIFRVSHAGSQLRWADTLILSENWYDTAFSNELNGPMVSDPAKMIKTTPEAVQFYRAALANEHPLLEPAVTFSPSAFMPELLVHRAIYGSFTQFVGDIVVFRIRR